MTRTKSVKALIVVLMSAALIIAFMPQMAFTSYAATAKKATSVTRSYPTTKATYSMTVGQSKTFRVRLNPKNLAKASKTTFWSLNTSKYASLAKGKYSTKYKKVNGYWYAYTTLKATKAGPVTITAKSKYGPTASWNVSVKKVLTDVTISNETTGSMTAITVGDVLKANIAPATKYAKYTWYAVAADGTKTALTDEAQKDSSYKVTGAAAGKQIMVEANGFTYAQGKVESKATTAKVATVKLLGAANGGVTSCTVGTAVSPVLNPVGATAAYQWYLDGMIQVGQTGSSYTPIVADLGKMVTCKVAASEADLLAGNGVYDVTFGTVNQEPSAVATISLSSPVSVGKSVTASVLKATDSKTAYTGATVTYRWYTEYVANDATKQTAATGSGNATATYTPVSADTGKTLTCVATFAPTATVFVKGTLVATTAAVTNTVKTATLSGAKTVGSKLSVTAVDQSGATLTTGLSYQWYSGSTPISGATSKDYTTTTADYGNSIFCKVTGTGSVTGSDDSDVFTITAAEIAGVSVKNTNDETACAGEVLKAVTDPASASDTVTYQWYKASTYTTNTLFYAEGNKIKDATSQTYTPTDSNAYYGVKIVLPTGVTAYSGITSDKDVATPVKPAIKVTGVTVENTTMKTAAPARTTNQVGDTLTATKAPTDATVTYQWYRDNDANAIESATDATYVLTADDVNHSVYCKITGTGSYASTAKSNVITNIVKVPTLLTTASTITDPKVGTAITAVKFSGTWKTDYTLQWYRGNTAIAGETGETYTPVAADYGQVLKVVATAMGPTYSGTTTLQANTTVAAVALGTVTIAKSAGSNAVVGDTLTAKLATGQEDATVTYQWYRGTTAIASVTSATYTLTDADVAAAANITVKVTPAANTAYTAATTVDASVTFNAAAGSTPAYWK
ncbi:hypothetical protein [Aminicella lysinilytica]|uniref:Ig-like domain-containing protein n=1 Tax=Aminicella lysinilytica TaxID=433323 RepID=A0A4R6PXN3_9FIRM|nr:hypothetical protein [Aminicella lysinilytica]TDP51056.1 hypothetical protein EV211_13419 [Aminicella lysinilytica]